MINLIINEFYKLHRKRFFLISGLIILIACVLYMIFFTINDDTQTQKELLTGQLDAEKAYLSQIEDIQWETDIEMQSAILQSQATIARLQYMLDHDIATWDWRSDVLSEYYTNQTIISLLQNGQNPEDYGYTAASLGNGETTDAMITRLATLCDQQRRLVENDDYLSYCQSQLDQAQKQYNEQYTSLTTYEIVVQEAVIESWKLYIQYQTPPHAKDQWKSVAIEQLEQEKEMIARCQYGEAVFASQEEYDRQLISSRRKVRIYEYALEQDTMPLTVYSDMIQYNNNVTTYAMFLCKISNVMYVVMVLGILLGAALIASEFSYGTIKTLVLYPYRRSTIAAAKLITLILSIMLMSLLIPVLAALAGRILFSNGVIGTTLSTAETPVYITYLKGHIIEIPFSIYIVFVFGCECARAVIVSIFSLMLSTVTQSFIIPTGVMVFLSLIGGYVLQIVYTFIYPLKLFRYLLFGNLNLMQYITGDLVAPYASATTSLFVLLLYVLVALVIYFRNFSRKEIIN